MPLLLLVIDNYFAFGENYESLEGRYYNTSPQWFSCGIQVIVSANRMNDMKFPFETEHNEGRTVTA